MVPWKCDLKNSIITSIARIYSNTAWEGFWHSAAESLITEFRMELPECYEFGMEGGSARKCANLAWMILCDGIL